MTLTEDELARLETAAKAVDGTAFMVPVRPGTILSLIAALRATPVADTAGIDVALQEAETSLPDDWELELSVGRQGRRDLYTATASYCYSLRHYRENVGRARFTPFEMTHADSAAAALHALTAALRTPKPEGDR